MNRPRFPCARRPRPLEAEAMEPIAIVGLACRFPGAPNASAFWSLLCAGHESIRIVPPDRWSAAEYRAEEPGTGRGQIATTRGGFVDDLDRFDYRAFGIPEREAAALDPQQRMLL